MKSNGFTLIELLAVILILGIIALIAVPSVNKVIDESKKEAFEISTSNLVRAIETDCQLQILDNKDPKKTYTFSDGEVSPSIDVKGGLPTSGTATVDSNCKVSLNVSSGKLIATKAKSAYAVTLSKGSPEYAIYTNGTPIYFNPVSGQLCLESEAISTAETKTGCMKWYTFNDTGETSSTINLILNHNTTATIAWNSNGSNEDGGDEVLTQLKSDTSSWLGVETRSDSYSVDNGWASYTIDYSTYKARLMTAEDIAVITQNSSFDEPNARSIDWFFLDSNTQTQTATTIGTSNYSWLFDYTNGCTSYGCNIADSSNYGYWTSTAVFGRTDLVWIVSRSGQLFDSNVDTVGNYGVRPVITLSKLNL